MAGVSYFSTRAGAWPTDFSPGEKVVEPCSIFIDVIYVPVWNPWKMCYECNNQCIRTNNCCNCEYITWRGLLSD